MVGRCISYWGGLFSGAMLVSGAIFFRDGVIIWYLQSAHHSGGVLIVWTRFSLLDLWVTDFSVAVGVFNMPDTGIRLASSWLFGKLLRVASLPSTFTFSQPHRSRKNTDPFKIIYKSICSFHFLNKNHPQKKRIKSYIMILLMVQKSGEKTSQHVWTPVYK